MASEARRNAENATRLPVGPLMIQLSDFISAQYTQDDPPKPQGLRHIACGHLLRDPQMNGTKIARHIFVCKSSSMVERQRAWEASRPLKEKYPNPMLPRNAAPMPPTTRARETLIYSPERNGQVDAAFIGKAASFQYFQPSHVLPRAARPRVAGVKRSRSDYSSDISSTPDCSSSDDAAIVQVATANFFVENQIPFNVASSESYKVWVKALCQGGLKSHLLPTRDSLAGPLLDQVWDSAKTRVTELLRVWCKSHMGTLGLYGWTRPDGTCILNILILAPGAATFLDSIEVRSSLQTAHEVARHVLRVVEKYTQYIKCPAVSSDTSELCLKVKEVIAEKYPSMVPLPDQCHTATVLLETFAEIDWVRRILEQVKSVLEFFLFADALVVEFRTRRDEHDQLRMPRENDGEDLIAKFSMADKSKYSCIIRVLDDVVVAKPVFRSVVDAGALQECMYADTAAGRKRVSVVLELVKSVSFWDDVHALRDALAPAVSYLKLWELNDMSLCAVYDETMKLLRAYEALVEDSRSSRVNGGESQRNITVERMVNLVDVLRQQIHGPSEGAFDSLLLHDIHYLAALLAPKTSEETFSDLFIKSTPALMKYFANSATIFAGDELAGATSHDRDTRLTMLNVELGSYIGGTGLFAVGRSSANIVLEAAAWWKVFGISTPRLSRVALVLAGLRASTGSEARFFTSRERLCSVEQPRLSNERHKKLMFAHWNLRLLNDRTLVEDEAGAS